MMETIDFIDGLRRQNSDALGFIPLQTLQKRYVNTGQYILIPNRGYLIHGVGLDWRITQACIEYDHRRRGHGIDMVQELIERAKQKNARRLLLRCADDLDANDFWLSAGFSVLRIIDKQNRRNRKIFQYEYTLWPKLLTSH